MGSKSVMGEPFSGRGRGWGEGVGGEEREGAGCDVAEDSISEFVISFG